MPSRQARPRVAEFFAGIGLVRAALESEGCDVIWANDIEPAKRALYAANFDASHFVLGDIRGIRGEDVPRADLATASFPCTDLSLAGNRAGLSGSESSMLWEFLRVLNGMGTRRPRAVLLENVVGFATSHGGRDLKETITSLNGLGYLCDVFVADARWFVPQSRPRMFIIGSQERIPGLSDWAPSALRPKWITRFVEANPELHMQAHFMRPPHQEVQTLRHVVEQMPPQDERWWDGERLSRFLDSLSSIQSHRLLTLQRSSRVSWATAYRRTRQGRAVWEIRADEISGCLRTARGGSSKQAVVEAGRDYVRVRWMTPLEYARLQGAPDYDVSPVRASQAYFGFGDAVCVPVVAWIAREYLKPLICGELGTVVTYRDEQVRPPSRSRANPRTNQAVLWPN